MNRMKKNIFLLVLISLYFNCATYMKTVPKGQIAEKGKLYIVSRVLTEFDFFSDENGNDKKIPECYLFFSKNKETDPGVSGDVGDVFLTVGFGEYFVAEIPADYLYIKGFSRNSDNDELMQISTRIKINHNGKDTFLYIGDIVFYMENDYINVKAEDNSERMKNEFFEYIRDSTGNFLLPEASMFSFENPAVLRIYKLVMGYDYAFINGNWQMVPRPESVLILEK